MKVFLILLSIFFVQFANTQTNNIKSIIVSYDYGEIDTTQNQYGNLFDDTIYFDEIGFKTKMIYGGDGMSTDISYFNYKDGLLTSVIDDDKSKRLFYYNEDRLDSIKSYGQYNRLLGEEYYFYNDSSELVKTKVWFPVLKREDSTEISYGPNWKREIQYSTPLKSEGRQTFFNDKGDEKEIYISKSDGTVWCEKYEYTYDSKGNWISKSTIERLKDKNGVRAKWNKGSYIVNRAIVYY